MTHYISLTKVESITVGDTKNGFSVFIVLLSGKSYLNQYVAPYKDTLIENLTSLQGFIKAED